MMVQLNWNAFLEASPAPDIKWFYEQNELQQGGRFAFRLDNTGSEAFSAVLQIKDLDDSDAGAYRCAITNAHGRGNANFNLKLTGFSAPTFVEKPKISSRDDGQVLVMEFKAKSKSKPTVVWTKSDDIVAESDRVHLGVNDAGNNEYHIVLEIKEPTKEKDAGQFVCTVKNESGKLTATFTSNSKCLPVHRLLPVNRKFYKKRPTAANRQSFSISVFKLTINRRLLG